MKINKNNFEISKFLLLILLFSAKLHAQYGRQEVFPEKQEQTQESFKDATLPPGTAPIKRPRKVPRPPVSDLQTQYPQYQEYKEDPLEFEEEKTRFWYSVDEQMIEEAEKRLFLQDSLVPLSRDSRTGLVLKDFDTSSDNRRLTFAYLGNADIREANEISTFEFVYSFKWDSYWIELGYARTSADPIQIMRFNPNVAQEDLDLYDETQNVNEFTLGLMVRTKYLRFLWNRDDIFETISGGFSYVNLNEPFYDNDYKGVGVKADMGIHMRVTSNYHIGLRYSYHIASLKRSRLNSTEASYIRHQLIDWSGLGIELSFYY